MTRTLLLSVLLVGVSLLAAGCESTDTTFLLLKAQIEPAGQNQSVDVISLAVVMPDYLNRPQLVKRTSDYTLRYDEFHRWAEPLEDILAETLAENLRNATGYYVALVDPEDATLLVSVHRFDDDGDNAFAEFECTFTRVKRAVLFVKAKNPISSLSAQSIPAAQSKALATLATKIAKEMK
jgi:uncharacterized lipoprotein YmbA